MASRIDYPSSLWMVETSRRRIEIIVKRGQNVEDCGGVFPSRWGPKVPTDIQHLASPP